MLSPESKWWVKAKDTHKRISTYISLGCNEMFKETERDEIWPALQRTPSHNSLVIKPLSLPFLYVSPSFSPASSPIVDHFTLHLSPFLSHIHQLAPWTALELYYSEGTRCLCAGTRPCTPTPSLLNVGIVWPHKTACKLLLGLCCTLQPWALFNNVSGWDACVQRSLSSSHHHWYEFASVTPAPEDKPERFTTPPPRLGFTWEAW